MDPDQLSALADATRRFGLLQQTPRFSAERARMAEAMADPLLQEKQAELRARTGQTEAETAAIPRKLDIQEQTARSIAGLNTARGTELTERNPTKLAVAQTTSATRLAIGQAMANAQNARTDAERAMWTAHAYELSRKAHLEDVQADMGGWKPTPVHGIADANGVSTTHFLTPGQMVSAESAGGLHEAAKGAEANRVGLGRTVLTTHGQLQDMLQDPEVQANLGPLAGRGFRIEQAIGQTTSQRTQEFLSEVQSFLSSQMAMHQSRNLGVVKDFEDRFANSHMSPADFGAGLLGIAHWSENTVANAPRNVMPTYPAAPTIPGAGTPGTPASPAVGGLSAQENDILNSLKTGGQR